LIEARQHERDCLIEVCRQSWDPRDCPKCGRRDEAHPAPICTSCGHEWNPDVCPACKKSNFKENTLAELFYEKPDGLCCQGCFHVWRRDSPADIICPECGSADVVESYPEIPVLERDDPGLALVLFVEGQMPRSEGGALLWLEAIAWLRFHGARERAEVLEWEWFFREIASIRARIVEELMPTPKADGEEEREE
jgi:hypothetical protein